MRKAIKCVKKKVIVQKMGSKNHDYQEIQILQKVCKGQLNGVVSYLDSFSDVHAHYIVTEYYPCGDLKEFVMSRNSPLNEREAKQIIWQLAFALKGLHD